MTILSALDDKECGLIIGLPDIIDHSLTKKLASQFTPVDPDKEEERVAGLDKFPKFSNSQGVSLSDKFVNRLKEDGSHRKVVGLKRTIAHKSYQNGQPDNMLHAIADDPSSIAHRIPHQYDGEDDEVTQHEYWDDAWQKNEEISGSKDEDVIDSIMKNVFSNDKSFIEETRQFLEPWRDIFSRTLSNTPAKLEPLEIIVDSTKWETRTSQGPPRMMSSEKEEHIRKFVEEGLSQGIIRPCKEAHYSQVHLVPKPAGPDGKKKMRTTIDYRFLNQCSTPQTWPLPNIAQMLQRIGKAKPTYFAKLDMTWGYWQAPLAESCKRFTAFITFMGIFEWNRAPMGTQASGGYFHRMISFTVLSGLVYNILEAYIDDLLVHAQTKEEMFRRLTEVFQRFRDHNIKFNPDKVLISDSDMEFVGHVITPTGITFSPKKLNGIAEIPIPITKGDLKKFIGVANYFRDHVKGHSDMSKAMHDMLPNYTRSHRNQRLKWSQDQEQAFYTLRAAVEHAPMLSWINEMWKIGLETDASDYGIGAFLFQIDPTTDKKIPIQFLSKSLTGAQLRWSTPEKEMYAFFYAVKKLSWLLGDKRFTWYTDHKNNTLTRITGSDKVLRWDLYLQEFNFTKEFIQGEKNEITDSFSRLCKVEDKDPLHAVPALVSDLLAQLCEKDETDYITVITGTNAPLPSSFLNSVFESEGNKEVLAAVAIPRTIDDVAFNKIARVHNATVGHLGVERTIYKLTRLNQTWPSMRTDVVSFIKLCDCCQKLSRIRVPIHTSRFTTASYGLMNKLSMDCMGPFKTTEGGYTHILVIIDNFSRYTTLHGLKSLSGIQIAQCLLEHIGTFGTPNIIQMDNGSEFLNEVVSETTKLLNTSGASILAYSKEENAIVERCNKEVLRHLQALVFEINKRDTWIRYLPLVQRIINSQISSVTGASPNDLLFGGKLNLDRALITPSLINFEEGVSVSAWSSELIATQDKLINVAAKQQADKDRAHMLRKVDSVTQFRPNSFVLVQYPSGAMGKRAPTKLHTHWKGPMRVVSNKGPEYTIHDLVRNTDIKVHVTRLKQFEHDATRTNPKATAAKDYEEDEVEAILAHSGNPKYKSHMDFLVRWMGYDESHDSWLPWSELRLNSVLHQYLSDNNMTKLIPQL